MRLFYVEKIDPSSKTCIIKGSEARHIYKVLRMDVGDTLFLMDGKGKRYRAVIKKIEHGSVYVKIEGAFESPEDPPVKIVLCISLIRSDPFDLVIQKTSELGVDTIQPFYSERTIVRIPEERLKERMRHWNEVAKSAAKQCGRKKPINLLEPVFLDELLERIRDDKALKIFLWEKEEKISINKHWTFSLVWVYATGNPMTAPAGRFRFLTPHLFRKRLIPAGFIACLIGKRDLVGDRRRRSGKALLWGMCGGHRFC